MKQIVIYNTTGQIVKKIDCNEDVININIEEFTAGIYLLNITDEKGYIVTKKISITK